VTRDQFIGLPLSVVLGIMWDMSPAMAEKLRVIEPPKLPRPPKYDSVIFRRDGVTYASEYDVEGLRYWRDMKLSSDKKEYAEKNAKEAKALDYWIQWRMVEPYRQWSGERNRENVTAKPPSGKPEVYPRTRRGRDSSSSDAPPESEYTPSFDEDDGDVPF
jgi:hypothetical protein